MSDLNGDTLMAQVLTNVIIGNTSSGKGDHFWDNGEGNLLKALILLIDQDRTRSPDMKHLPAVYQLLTQNSERQLTAMFDKLPLDHPARAPFNLFAQSSDTVRSGIILGLGTRLQVLQNQAVQRITSRSDIDLTAPGRNKCIYYIVLSDQDATMAFLSSLFFSFMFIKLTHYADGRPNGRCDVPVNLILDEFNNVGRIGGAEDGSDFARSLSVVRSRDIRVMLAVQSLGQLQNRYPKNLWSEIIGNCDIQLMLGCTDDVTAEYRSRQLIGNFAHDTNDERAAATALQYGEYVDPSVYGGSGEPYYRANASEAIAKAGYVGTVDEVAYRLATLVRNSAEHWCYVGSVEYGYIAVGVTYESGMWYCDIAVAAENTDNL